MTGLSTADDAWQVDRREVDGTSFVVRSRRGLAVPDPARPVQITVKVELLEQTSTGELGDADRDALADAERLIGAELADRGAVLVMVLTGHHSREFVAYGPTHEFLAEWGPSVLDRWGEGRPGTAVEAALEPDWETFRRFTSSD